MQHRIRLNDHDYQGLFGVNDKNITLIEESMGVKLSLRDNELTIDGEEEKVRVTAACLEKLLSLAAKGAVFEESLIRSGLQLAREDQLDRLDDLLARVIAYTSHGKPIRCRTDGQQRYIDTIRKHEMTIAVGPAGTGKTYLAVAMAVAALKNHEVEHIILTRPAVEAGEKLGFLPGDMTQKIDPYLRPLYDALYEMLGGEACQRMVERGILEVAPLAFMRGRTLSNSFIILDEAQNTTTEQMKMFLTRFGMGSRCVVTGDITQIDLPRHQTSGLVQALEVLKDERAIGIIRLTGDDVVRQELVRRIIAAYERYEIRNDQQNERTSHGTASD